MKTSGDDFRWLQLDALRAFAVFAVLLTHFSPTLQNLLPGLGFAGVRLFFVLSGFLITGILLRCRDHIAAGSSTAGWQLRQFYVRRALRILPAFYATLLIAAALGMGSAGTTFWWHFFYASNFLFAWRGAWLDLVTHFWSLAVEEQFYLFWPWLVLFVPERRLPLLIGLACVLGPVSRLISLLVAPTNFVAAIVLTPACLDQLGAGAFLAWLWHERNLTPVRQRWLSRGGAVLFIAGLPLWLCPPTMRWAVVLGPALQAAGFAALVDGAARGFGGVAGVLLTWRPLLWTGQISYGLYLLHNFSHWWAPRIMRQITHYRQAYFSSEVMHVLYLIALSFVAAALSWYLLERPVNRFKRHFHYAP
ncbi:MAG TPA: acyltransferase [Opitutaceae bacterium]|nr:acyltransferase [Opitutaceae bacterium]